MKKIIFTALFSLCSAGAFAQNSAGASAQNSIPQGVTESTDPAKVAEVERKAQEIMDRQQQSSSGASAEQGDMHKRSSSRKHGARSPSRNSGADNAPAGSGSSNK